MSAPSPSPVRGRAQLALALLLAAAACSDSGGSRTVLLVSLDSVRADALTFQDPDVSPQMTELAKRGTIFRQAVSGTSWTLPSHAQMFTGSPPVLHGTQYHDTQIDTRTETLPALLADAGWTTLGWYTGPYVAGEYGFDRGFAIYQCAMTGGAQLEAAYKNAVDTGDFERAKMLFEGRGDRSHQDVTSGNVVEQLSAHLSRADPDEDLFLFTHLFDPHYDYIPPRPWDRRFDPHYDGDIDGRDFYLNEAIYKADATPRRQISDRDLEHVLALYKGEIGWTDSHVGQVLDLLEEHGRLDDTLVIVTADHGDEFFDHGGRGHRHTLYDELLRVPMLIVPPRSAPPPGANLVDAQVDLSDLLPTVLDFAGVPLPADVWGRSLLPAVAGESFASRPSVGSLLSTDRSAKKPKYFLKDSYRTPERKLIRNMTVGPDQRPRLHSLELYDLHADRYEQAPQRDPTSPEVIEVWNEMEAELERMREHWRARERSSAAQRATRISEIWSEDLGDLGYTESTSGTPTQSLPWGVAPLPALPAPR